MAEQDPRRAILEQLVERSTKREPLRRSNDPTRPVASLSGRPFTADPATVRFLKERAIPGRRLFAVTFDDEEEQGWFWLVAAEQDQTGAWVASGGAGGSGHGPEQRDEPWVNLAGWWEQGRFYAGGQVHAAGADAARVRLRTANEVELEDDTEGAVVLFLTDRPAHTPVTMDIYDGEGQLLISHAAF